MDSNKFSIGGMEFTVSKINALKQFQIVRRIAPILADLVPVAQKFSKLTESQLKEDQAELIAPIMSGISKLSDADANKVLFALLAAVEIKQMPIGNWARVANDDRLMFEDLELPVLLQIAGRAFAFNMSGFFSAMPQVSHGGQ